MSAAAPFNQLLQTAAEQLEPQRLLFVFAQAELPDGATREQRERFKSGQGGALTPLACVDKAPHDLSTFNALVEEARNACPPWQVLFIAALSGQEGRPPSTALIDSALNAMVESVKSGRFGSYLALGPTGEAIQFS
jgi:hypothetical protein